MVAPKKASWKKPKLIKTVSKASTKQPRAKTKADEIYNARRRAKRAAAKLQKQIESGEIAQENVEVTKKYINSINKTIESSYAKKVKGGKREYAGNIESIKESLSLTSEITRQGIEQTLPNQNIQELQDILSPAEVRRKNEIWKRNINQASKKDGISPLDMKEVRNFFRVTKPLWDVKGITPALRYSKILSELGVQTLEQAWEIVTSSKYFKDLMKTGGTDEMDEIGSPETAIQIITKASGDIQGPSPDPSYKSLFHYKLFNER